MSVKPITDDNPSFTLEAKARDCPPLQFVREFTVNALEAIHARRRAGLAGAESDQVVWREFIELAGRAEAPKLACVDTGIGMAPDELERYINALSSTSKRQALDANLGMGAKIAGAVGNPLGLTYLSWTGSPDSGVTCTLAHDAETGKWGLEESPETLEIVQVADPELCPREIQQAGWRGTAVVFHGRTPEQDTTLPPNDGLGVDWIEKTVNIRFYELPHDIAVRCQRAGDRFVRRALGQRALLDEHTVEHGSHRLSDATVHWRILDQEHELRRKQNHRWAATGHRAAMHEGELFELRQHRAGGWRKLQEFGISFGHERVVLYVEPERALPDTVRAHLVIPEASGETKDLPWERWADEFVADMPEALRRLVERSAGQQAKRDRRDMMRRLERLAAEMPIPRYRLAPDGDLEGGVPTHGGTGGRQPRSQGKMRKPDDKPGSAHGGEVVTLFTRLGGPAVREMKTPRIPEIRPQWVSRELNNRPPGVLEDLAATFLPRLGVVQLNGDFRGYRALLGYFAAKYKSRTGSEPVVVAEVRSACEEQVIDFIIGVLRLRCQPHWAGSAEAYALDDRALTGCLMQHATLAARIDASLARRLRRVA
jgi:hypothetical protein